MSKKKPVAVTPAPAADPAVPPTVFPRTGEIHFHDTHVAIWEEIPAGARDVVFRALEDVFQKLIGHLRGRGFAMRIDPRCQKHYPSIAQWHWVGKRGGLEVKIEVCGRTASADFFQNVIKPDNPNGGQYDSDKFKKMPRDMRLRCAAEMISLIRAMQALGYTYGLGSDLYEPLAHAVLRKAERRELEDLSPLDRYNHGRSPRDRLAAWPAPESIQIYDRKDKDGQLLCNGDVRYFYGAGVRLVRGHVFHTSGNCWAAHLADGTWFGQPANFTLFSTDRPDLLPRRVVEETQVSRVSRELAHARSVQACVPGSPAPLARKLPAFLAWLAPILWAGAVTTAAARVSVLEGVLARVTAGERGYYVLSLKYSTGEGLSFWGPNNGGYVWRLSDAGRYQEAAIKSQQSYYDDEEITLAVPCETAEAFVNEKGFVPNTEKNRRALLRAAGEARMARGQSSVKVARRADRAARKAQPARATEAA